MSKKVNPRRRPCTQADIKRAKDEAQNEAIDTLLHISMYVLQDKFGFSPEQMKKYDRWFNQTVASISEGRLKMREIKAVLKEEYDSEVVYEE